LCGECDGNPEKEQKYIAQCKAIELASLGHKVHVLVSGANYNTVDFERGIWIHRIMPKEDVPSGSHVTSEIPRKLLDQSIAYLEELDRISTHRSIDIVQAPIDNFAGLAALESERYRMVTSLGAIDVVSILSSMRSDNDEALQVDEALEFIKLDIIKNSHGILTNSVETINAIDAIRGTSYAYGAFISSAQGLSALIEGYRDIVCDVSY
jgi:hypothetical protein